MRNFILFLAFSAVAFGQCGSAGRLIKNPLTGLWDCTAVVGAGTGSVTSVGLAGTANQITVTGATPITDSGSWTLSLPTAGVTLPGTTTIGILSAKQNVMDAVSFCSDAGSTDAYACDLTPAISTYVTGTHYRFLANTANTGAATVALNSLAAKTIVKVAGGITTALATNDIRVGQWVDVVYDGTNMQMQSTLGNAGGGGTPGGSDTQCQYNNSGAFGGITGCTTNGTTVTLASPIVTGTLTVGTSVLGLKVNLAAVSAPSAPTLSGAGNTGGSTTRGYTLVGCVTGGSPCGLGSVPSTEVVTTTSRATLTALLPVVITAPTCSGTAFYGFDVWSTSGPDSTNLRGNILCGGAFSDTGATAIHPYDSIQGDDFSVGQGSNNPFVSNSNETRFGCNAANTAYSSSSFYDTYTGFGVFTRTSCAGYGYNTFLVDAVTDTDRSNQAAAFDLELWADTITHDQSVFWPTIIVRDTLTMAALTDVNAYITIPSSGKTITGNITNYYAKTNIASNHAQGDISGYWASAPDKGSPTVDGKVVSFYSEDLAGFARPYYSWDDSRGVRRRREDNTFDSVGQSIDALYNPLFAKYVAGAVDFERVVLGQWNGNVAEIGTEKGGTGTLRSLRLIGTTVAVNSLATATDSLPVCRHTDGTLYNGTNTAGVLACP